MASRHLRNPGPSQLATATLSTCPEQHETLTAPETENSQNWPPWRQLVVDTARRILEYTGGSLVMPMTVLVEPYCEESVTASPHISFPRSIFVLYANQDTLRKRIISDRR